MSDAGDYYEAFCALKLESTDDFDEVIELGFTEDQLDAVGDVLNRKPTDDDVEQIWSVLWSEYTRKVGRA